MSSIVGWGVAAAIVIVIAGIAADLNLVAIAIAALVGAGVTAFGQWRLLNLDENRRRRHRHVDSD